MVSSCHADNKNNDHLISFIRIATQLLLLLCTMGCCPSKDLSAVVGNHPTKDEPMTMAEIESRIESIEYTKTATLGGIKVRYAYLSQRGYYPDGTCQHSVPGSIHIILVMTRGYFTFCDTKSKCTGILLACDFSQLTMGG